MAPRHVARALVVAFAFAAASTSVHADEAEDAYARAQSADTALDFSTALQGYRRALELRPSASFAARARVRAEDLAAHSEGGFVPLAKLEAVRRNPRAASDPDALEALSRDAVTFPPGRVRGEALLLAAEGLGKRLKMPERSVGPAEALARDTSVDRVVRAQALSIAVDEMVALGQRARAYRLAHDLRAISPTIAARFEREGRRDSLRTAAVATLGLVLVAGLAAALMLFRRGAGRKAIEVFRSPAPYLVALVLSFGGAWLGHTFDESVTSRPFFFLAAGVLLVDRSVALVTRAARWRGARWVALGGGLLGIVSAALLSLILSDPMFIESFGL